MGQMAAEIAHEVGTPLNVIGGRARALAKKAEKAEKADRLAGVEPGEVAREAGKVAGIIVDEVARITKIIRQVLDFSRSRGPTLTRVDLGAVVADALQFLGEGMRRQGILVEGPAGPVPQVPGDPDQIQQVCLNLMTNAIHAMPHGGTLHVSTDRVVRRKGGLDLVPPAEYAVLAVKDTGPGIPGADRDRIFEPFFTTKDAGQGTGLGLAVSNGIVKDHDGWIEVDSPPGGGAEFRVFLPFAVVTEEPSAGEPTQATLAERKSIGKD